MADKHQKVSPMVEVGSTGLARFGQYVYEEWLSDLQGGKAIKVYKEMRDNDPIIGSILFAIKMLCRSVDWQVLPGGTDGVDQEAADFLDSCRADMSTSWQDFMTEALSMLVFGFSWHEIVYKKRTSEQSQYNDGRIGWAKLPIRAQESFYGWDFDPDTGSVLAYRQLPPPDYQLRVVPITKSLLFRTEATKGNPEGRSILRNAYRPWYFKKNIEVIEGIGIERDLAGLPIVWVPPNIANATTAEEKAALAAYKQMVTNIRRDQQEGIVMPLDHDTNGNKTYDITLLSTMSRRQFDTNAIINRLNTQIAQTVLADFIMLGTQATGSFALSSDKTELFAVAIGAFLDEIQDVLNTFAIPRLFGLNTFRLQRLPKFLHGDIESPNLTELGNFIANLAKAGMPLFPNPALEKALASAAHLPTEGVGEE